MSQRKQKSKTKPGKHPFRRYPIDYLHIDTCENHTGENKGYLFVAVDRTSKFVHCYIAKHSESRWPIFSRRSLTKRRGTEAYKPYHFDVNCHRSDIEHRLTRTFQQWPNGQVERMNRTLKEAITQSFHYAALDEVSLHLKNYL